MRADNRVAIRTRHPLPGNPADPNPVLGTKIARLPEPVRFVYIDNNTHLHFGPRGRVRIFQEGVTDTTVRETNVNTLVGGGHVRGTYVEKAVVRNWAAVLDVQAALHHTPVKATSFPEVPKRLRAVTLEEQGGRKEVVLESPATYRIVGERGVRHDVTQAGDLEPYLARLARTVALRTGAGAQ